MLTCPNCGAITSFDLEPRPASKAPEDVVARRTKILENHGVRATQLAVVLGCSVATIHRVRREYELK